MGGFFSPTHLIIIAIVALIIFGPKRLPEFGRSLARMLHEFKTGFKDAADSVHQEMGGENAPAAGTASATAAPSVQAVTVSAQYCRQCGTALEHDSQFCRKCGMKVTP